MDLGLVDQLRTSDEYLLARAAEANLYRVCFERPRSLPERLGRSVAQALDRSFVAALTRVLGLERNDPGPAAVQGSSRNARQDMSRLRLRISMSLDGFVAGPGQSVEHPLGIGGMRLHEWVLPLAVWRGPHGLEGGEVNASTAVVEEAIANVGATLMGRNMFGGHPGPWDAESPWNGWWGNDPPFHHPVFVLTHHPREPLELEGGTRFTFVTAGIHRALDLARGAAGDRDISLAGGASVARQYLAAGVVDEMLISLVPTLLGSGERLFEGLGDDYMGSSSSQTVPAPGVIHLKFASS